MTAHDLETRVGKLEKALSAYSQELGLALRYIQADAGSSLTKSRIVLEKLLLQVYVAEMGCEPRKPLLGDMLSDHQFTRKIERRILSRMNAVRDMANLGPHGEAVEPNDAASVLDALCEVMDWYLRRYVGQTPAAMAGACAPSALAASGKADTSPASSVIDPATAPPSVPERLKSRGLGRLPGRWWILAASVAVPLVLVAATIIVVRTGPGAGKVPAGGKDPVVDGVARKNGGGKEEKHAATKPEQIDGEPAGAEMSPAVKAQLPGLEDKDARVRREAALRLRKLGDKAAVPALISRIADDTWGETKGYIATFRDDTPYEDVATGPNQGSKYAALEALRELAPERVTEALQQALASRQPRVIEWAVRNLADQKASGATVQAVAEQLAHKDARVRREAARTLGKLGDPAAVPALISRIADDAWGETKGHFATFRDDTPYEDMATGPNQGSKYAALEALKKLAPKEVMKALGMAQQSGNPEVRKWAFMQSARLKDGK